MNRKRFLITAIVCFLVFILIVGAKIATSDDVAITGLTTHTNPTADDMYVIVNDPNGTPVTYNIKQRDAVGWLVSATYSRITQADTAKNVIIGLANDHTFWAVGNQTAVGSYSDANAAGTGVLTCTAHGLSAANGDLVLITDSTTAADEGLYRLTDCNTDTITVSPALTGSDHDVDFTIFKDIIAVTVTDGTNGQMIQGYSHQNKPLQIGGDSLAATGHSLTGEDLLIGGDIEINGALYLDSTISDDINMLDATPAITLIDSDDQNETARISANNGDLTLVSDPNAGQASSKIVLEIDGAEKHRFTATSFVTPYSFNYVLDPNSSNDTYTGTLTPAPAAYTTGMCVLYHAMTANTGACTINLNSLGAKSIKMLHDQDPADNYIEDGSIALLVYDGTNFQLLSPDANP